MGSSSSASGGHIEGVRDHAPRPFRKKLLRTTAKCFLGWALVLSACETCAHGPSLDDYDWTVTNHSNEDVMVTPISPPDDAGEHQVVCRRPFKERRFLVNARTSEVINLETGDCGIAGFVIESDGGIVRFAPYGPPYSLVLDSIEQLRLATPAERRPHEPQPRQAAIAAAWFMVPPIATAWLLFLWDNLVVVVAHYIAERRTRSSGGGTTKQQEGRRQKPGP